MARVYCSYPLGYPWHSPYQSHQYSPDLTTQVWEPDHRRVVRHPTMEEYRAPISRSTFRRRGRSRSSICQLCQHRSCRCRSVESSYSTDSSTICNSCGERACYCSTDQSPVRRRQTRRSDTDQRALNRSIELFDQYKKDKRHDQANEVYREAIHSAGRSSGSDAILKLKASFADMQATQGNYREAEDILKDISRWRDRPRVVKRLCDEVHGKILHSRKRYSEAEDLYRSLYDRNSKDEWSFKMGEQLCQVIASQGDYDMAQLESVKLWENRKKNLGRDNPSTVKSAITAVEHISKLIQKLPQMDGLSKERCDKRKLVCEADIVHVIHDIWKSTASASQRQEASMLKAGHELGRSLHSLTMFTEAERYSKRSGKAGRPSLGNLTKTPCRAAFT